MRSRKSALVGGMRWRSDDVDATCFFFGCVVGGGELMIPLLHAWTAFVAGCDE